MTDDNRQFGQERSPEQTSSLSSPEFIPTEKPFIAGIGASAGGLDALIQLFEVMPSQSGICFVIIQHLDPTHDSALTEILSRKTSLNVQQITENLPLEPDRIYVIPPGKYVSIKQGNLILSDPTEGRGSRMAINYFFKSLARDARELAIGIILSGTGNDGSSGLKEIKHQGGLSLVQQPSEAQHSGMPQSALSSVPVDWVLSADKMAAHLVDYVRHQRKYGTLVPTQQLESPSRGEELIAILDYLKQQTNQEFHSYRSNTLLRRIRRRMGLHQLENFSDYLHYLRDNQEEVKSLRCDLLIGVTRFFRNPEAWELLQDKVIRPLVEQSSSSQPIRVWAAGCATGEEAYSLSILLHEEAQRANKRIRFQVFATDIATDALDVARGGFYPTSISGDVSSERLRQFFTKEDFGYRVSKDLRRSVVFAEHNVLFQPPFTKLHLISCRNLLIYLEPSAQKRVLNVFQFALHEEGVLFLGNSESIGKARGLFQPISKSWRIFQRTGVKAWPLLESTDRHGTSDPAAGKDEDFMERTAPILSTVAHRVQRQLFKEMNRGIVVVNGSNRVLFLQGDIDTYLQLSIGELNAELPDLMELVREGLRSTLRVAIRNCRESGKPESSMTRFRRDGDYIECRIQVRLLEGSSEEEALLISFDPQTSTESVLVPDRRTQRRKNRKKTVTDQEYIEELEHELATTREQLNATIEDLETANEELKAANEEAISINEELQSGNEELETSKEELQSLNEELTTLNNQLEMKVTELQNTTDDLDNLLNSTSLPTLFLDTEFKIRRFTTSSQELFSLIESDIGRPLTDISPNFQDEKLLSDAEKVLRELQPREQEIQTSEGQTFIRRVLPYRTEDNRIRGVVLTFTDVTSQTLLTQQLQRREAQQKALAKLGYQAITGHSLQDLLDKTVETIQSVLHVDFIKILELLPSGKEMLLRAGTGWEAGLVGNITVPTGAYSQGGYTLSTLQPVIVEDLQADKRFSCPQLLSEYGVVSGISTIIHGPERPYGVLGVHTKKRVKFSEQDVHFVTSAANILGEAIHRKQVEELIRDREERFSALVAAASQIVWTTNGEGEVVEDSPSWRAFTGQTVNQWKGWGWLTALHPDDRDWMSKTWQKAVRDQSPMQAEYRLMHVSGEYRWTMARGVPLLNPDGSLRGWIGMNTDITEQREREAELKRLAEHNSLALSAGKMGTWEWDLQKDTISWSKELLKIFEVSPEEFDGSIKNALEFIHPEDRESVRQRLQSVITSSETSYQNNFRLLHPDGRVHWMQGHGIIERDPTGRALMVTGITVDITDRKKYEKGLIDREAHLRRVIDNMLNFVAILEPDGTLLEVNQTAIDVAGMKREEALGKKFWDCYWWNFSDESVLRMKDAVQRASQGEIIRYDVEARVLNEQRITADFMLKPVTDETGKITYLIPSGVDISDRIKNERAVRLSEERLRIAAEATGFGSYFLDLETREISWSDEMKKILGRDDPQEHFINPSSLPDFIHPEDRSLVEQHTREALAPDGKGIHSYDHRVIRPDGEVRWISVKGKTIYQERYGHQIPIRIVGTISDITERKKVEDHLRESEQRYRLALSAAQLGTWHLQRDSRITERDPRLNQILGYLDEYTQATLESYFSLIHPEDQQVIREIIEEAIKQQKPYSLEYRINRQDGFTRWIRETARPLGESEQQIGDWIGAVSDITDQKQFEESLLLARKMAEQANQTRGEFLANMSHEIRTPMTAILGYADILSNHLESSENLQYVEIIRRNGRFLLEIINDILDLSKIDAGKLHIECSSVPPDRIVEEVVSLMEVRAAEKGITIEIQYRGQLPRTIQTDPKRLRQILLNLVGNAIKFTNEGTITIGVEIKPEKEEILFEIIDTGIGIEEEQIESLFEPFTQADSSASRTFGGTGLGLPISRRLAQMLGGTIHVSSNVNVGSTFAVTVATGSLDGIEWIEPSEYEKSFREKRAYPEQQIQGKILIVDDRREVRHLAQHFLQEAGAEVVTVRDGQEVLKINETFGEIDTLFDLILIDMQMPILDGYQTVARLRELGSKLPIIAMTAHAMHSDRDKCLKAGCNDYTTKPLDPQELIQMISKYLKDAEPESEPVAEVPSFQLEKEADSGYRILLVEDNLSVCHVQSMLLEMKGHQVEVAFDGETAITKASEFLPDVILLDLGLPDISGYEVIRRLKEAEQFQKTLFIALSGRGGDEDFERTQAAGFDRHLVKPADIEIIDQSIRGIE
ncbi:Hypothetical protein PBC10988_14340 [Planctomycetales bacterium 10988]|nr:Hypothetical protein PBC10988_14340 [Planctomycetales bacterium 10988]